MGIDSLGGAAPGLVDGSPFSESINTGSSGDFPFFQTVDSDDVRFLISQISEYDDEKKLFKSSFEPIIENPEEELLYMMERRLAFDEHERRNDAIAKALYNWEDISLWKKDWAWTPETLQTSYQEAAERLGLTTPPNVYYFSPENYAQYRELRKHLPERVLGFFGGSPETGGVVGNIVVVGATKNPKPNHRRVRSLFHELAHGGVQHAYPYGHNPRSASNPYNLELFQHGREFATKYAEAVRGIVADDDIRNAWRDLAFISDEYWGGIV